MLDADLRGLEALWRALIQEMEVGEIEDVRVGLHWTLVTARVGGEPRAGLATTMPSVGHHHRDWPDVDQPGQLASLGAQALAEKVLARSPVERSIGLATLNALLPSQPHRWVELNAEEVIAEAGAGKTVVLIGHFPFVPRLKPRVGRLVVLELDPRGEDLPAERAPEWIPQADVLAITSVTLLNRTLMDILSLRQPHALTLLLGPSTPLSPRLFDEGIDILSGAWVTDRDAVAARVCQGAGFRQLHPAGVRLVTMRGKMGV